MTRTTSRIATRNGRPAWVDAPKRLRASQIERPTRAEERKGLLKWWKP